MGCAGKLEPISCKTFPDTFGSVLTGGADFAAIPLENSSVGSIVANYDLLAQSHVVIVSEVYVPVHHYVLGIPGCTIAGLKEVYSHPVALDQCRDFLSSVPDMRAVA